VIFRFADPWNLLLLVLLPLLGVWYKSRGRGRRGALAHPSTGEIRAMEGGRGSRLGEVPVVLRLLALMALVLALGRPQSGVTSETVTAEGIDIMLAVDISSSMLAEDLTPNRLEATKSVAAEFVEGRTSDRIGLVVFAGRAFTQAPLTLDHSVVTTFLSELQVGMVEDGTAVGMGLATAVKRLQSSEAASKVVVLLTDGRNNRGQIDPLTAAELAQATGVKVYTVGAGSHGLARVPVDGAFGRQYVQTRVDVDEETLRQVAELSGGRYYRATDRASLEAVYAEIDQLETTTIEVENFTQYGELFYLPLLFGLALLALEIGLSHTVLRTLP